MIRKLPSRGLIDWQSSAHFDSKRRREKVSNPNAYFAAGAHLQANENLREGPISHRPRLECDDILQ